MTGSHGTRTQQVLWETPYWREARIEPLSCQLQRIPAYDPEPTHLATLLIQLWFCYHTESLSEAEARSSAIWFCSDSVTIQSAPVKLTHDRMPYDSSLILLPLREPQRNWRTIECHTILLRLCCHTESTELNRLRSVHVHERRDKQQICYWDIYWLILR